jgi:hypothetical protein
MAPRHGKVPGTPGSRPCASRAPPPSSAPS